MEKNYLFYFVKYPLDIHICLIKKLGQIHYQVIHIQLLELFVA
jgi:hypothetical protein